MSFPPEVALAPPHTYDDPRMQYDEQCFFYDGGYDLLCLYDSGRIPKKQKGKGSGGIVGGRKPKSHPQPEFIEYIFKTSIIRVNDDVLPDNEKTKKYHILDKPNNIFFKIDDLKTKTKSISIKSEILKVKTLNPILKEHMSSSLYFCSPNKIKIHTEIITKKNNE